VLVSAEELFFEDFGGFCSLSFRPPFSLFSHHHYASICVTTHTHYYTHSGFTWYAIRVVIKDDKLVVVIFLVVVVIVQQEDTTNEPFFSKSKKVTSLAEIGRQRWLKSSKLVTGVIKII